MSIVNVTKPKYNNVEKTSIDVLVQFDGWAAPVPFTASPDDPEPHGVQLFTDLILGKYGPIEDYAPPAKPLPGKAPNVVS